LIYDLPIAAGEPGEGSEELLTHPGVLAGAPLFVPPEQATDLHSVTVAGDQYSAAATLYFLLTGHAPYDSSGQKEDPFAIVRKCDPVPIRSRRPDLPIPLATILFQAMQRRTRDRFADVTAFEAALVPFAG